MSHKDSDDGSDRDGRRSDFSLSREEGPVVEIVDEDETLAVLVDEEDETVLINDTQLTRYGYTSDVPWEDLPADVVVICCSDQRFGRQNRQFLRALGYNSPHFIQVPSGLAVFHGLAAVSGFLPKAMGSLLDKAIDLTKVKKVICIAHHDCGGYKLGRIEILGKLSRRLSGMDIKDVQLEHLHKAARDLQARLGREVTVQAFYADVVDEQGSQKVYYSEIDINRRRQHRSA